MGRWRRFRDWVGAQWKDWCQAWRDVRADSRRCETITVPLEEYCVLLGAANREAKALERLGEAQETIRRLNADVFRLRHGNICGSAAAEAVY